MISGHGTDGSLAMLVVVLPVVAYALWVYLAALGAAKHAVLPAVAAAGSLVAALLHWAVAPEHLRGWWPAGLFFLAYVRDPRTHFIPMQTKMATNDALMEYLRFTSSALFAVPPGIRPGEYVGQRLFT